MKALTANTNTEIGGPYDALLTQAPQMIATVVHIPYSLNLDIIGSNLPQPRGESRLQATDSPTDRQY